MSRVSGNCSSNSNRSSNSNGSSNSNSNSSNNNNNSNRATVKTTTTVAAVAVVVAIIASVAFVAVTAVIVSWRYCLLLLTTKTQQLSYGCCRYRAKNVAAGTACCLLVKTTIAATRLEGTSKRTIAPTRTRRAMIQ